MSILSSTIIIIILNSLTVFLPGDLPLLGYILIKIISLIVTILCLLLIIHHKGKDKSEIVCLILLIVFFFFSYRAYSIMRNYNESRKDLVKTFGNNYHIVGVTKYDFKNCYNPYNYAFNVKLNDDSDIVFQAQYCSSGTKAAFYHPNHNFLNYYVPYYLEKFNTAHKSNIICDFDEHNDITLKFHNNDAQNVLHFVEYLYDNDYGVKYSLILYNLDEKKIVDNNEY